MKEVSQVGDPEAAQMGALAADAPEQHTNTGTKTETPEPQEPGSKEPASSSTKSPPSGEQRPYNPAPSRPTVRYSIRSMISQALLMSSEEDQAAGIGLSVTEITNRITLTLLELELLGAGVARPASTAEWRLS
ncbi:hypothetical protein Daus18300_000565 [Diaporthe australafricana]|uniref:Uncharacterized protein n=1 Tax=Diaporthe australafricana TaxID=127596 RepID=A0ABR3Y544_9PEZI